MEEDNGLVDFGAIDFPWPQKGDRLFVIGDDWWHNACLNYAGGNWHMYITGYKRAGDALVENLQSTRQHDFLVFPIVFLYRQYLELQLKHLILKGHELLDNPASFPKKHDLRLLWSTCRAVLTRLEPKISERDLLALDDAILEFCEVDPTSEAFRYPVNRQNEASLPNDLRYINLRNLPEVMGRISGFLDAASAMITAYIEYKRDMEQAFRESYGYE